MIHLQLYVFLFFQAAHSCTVFVGSHSYNFSSISTNEWNVTGPGAEHGAYTYRASFCHDRVACQNGYYGNLVRFKDGACVGVYGQWATSVNVKTNHGFQATYTSAEYCWANFAVHFKSQFNFLCDTSAGGIGSIKATQVGENICEYLVHVHTNLVCESSTPVNVERWLGENTSKLV